MRRISQKLKEMTVWGEFSFVHDFDPISFHEELQTRGTESGVEEDFLEHFNWETSEVKNLSEKETTKKRLSIELEEKHCNVIFEDQDDDAKKAHPNPSAGAGWGEFSFTKFFKPLMLPTQRNATTEAEDDDFMSVYSWYNNGVLEKSKRSRSKDSKARRMRSGKTESELEKYIEKTSHSLHSRPLSSRVSFPVDRIHNSREESSEESSPHKKKSHRRERSSHLERRSHRSSRSRTSPRRTSHDDSCQSAGECGLEKNKDIDTRRHRRSRKDKKPDSDERRSPRRDRDATRNSNICPVGEPSV
jgi:hypothetical protein